MQFSHVNSLQCNDDDDDDVCRTRKTDRGCARQESETRVKTTATERRRRREKGGEKNDRYRIKRRLVERLRFVFNSFLFCVDSSFAHLPPFTFPSSRLHRSRTASFLHRLILDQMRSALRTTDDRAKTTRRLWCTIFAAFALIMDLNSLVWTLSWVYLLI